jgi:hypothetical protein
MGLIATPLLAVLLVACGNGAASEAPTLDGDATATSVDGTRLVAALCETQDLAPDPDAAARTFEARAHGPLHELAASVADVDRGIAAQLHEAKQRAESALAAGDPDEIDVGVASLTSATRTSLELLGRSAPACGDGDS